ncbi:MAG: DNA translocase FtsK [Sphingobacteriaceae bacterium]|nr:MAG: DNA translocase FtsK [Sphingobacteriaceae bacterium]
MTVETTIILLIVIVAFLVVRSIRRKKKSTVILRDLVTSPSPIVSGPPVINIESKKQDDLEEAATNNDPLSSLNSEEDIKVENLNTVYIEPEFTVEESEVKRTAEQLVEEFGLYDPQLDLASYCHPPLEILNTEISTQVITEEELEIQKQRLIVLFETWRIGIQTITAISGPRSVLYEVVPALGVRIVQIKQTENDLILALGISGTKVIGHLPGRGTVGIEVPHRKPCIVSIYSVLNSLDFKKTKLDLPIVLGVTMFNDVYIADLATLPHLLISGSTGQGKSIAINAILLSLLYKKHPSELKFILIDTNSLELNLYRTLERHFLAKVSNENAIITNVHKVAPAISSLTIEMEERYNLLKNAQVRNIKEYNEKFKNRKLLPTEGNRYLPYFVIVIDEFSGLITNDEHNLEALIGKLAQQGRPVGIHLIISTQYAAANIITGGLKANFSARMAFRVSSSSDSNAILDQAGAEKLSGDGDMLFADGANIVRLQSPFVSTTEVKDIIDYIKDQRGYPSAFLLPDDPSISKSYSSVFDFSDRDPLFEEAAKLIVMHQQGSTALIQRKLKLGYNRAGRIIDQLEAAGVVGPFEGSKAREVLLPDDYSLEQFLSRFN